MDIEGVKRLQVYVASGGGLVAVSEGWHEDLAPLLGIGGSAGQQSPRTPLSTDIRFETDFLPGLQGVTIEAEAHVREVRLLPGAEVLVQSGSRVPIAWLYPYGSGRTLVWNDDLPGGNDSRGLMVASIMSVQPLAVQALANVGVIHVDDFPAPALLPKIDPIKHEYDLSMAEFYDRAWLPDMLELARRNDVHYTFLTAFNYNARVEPPFGFEEWEGAKVQYGNCSEPYGVHWARIIRRQHELGFHGYNHQPLKMSVWKSEENILAGLSAVSKRWREDGLGPEPHTYAAPDNTFDEPGIQALARAFPSIRIIAGSNAGGIDKGSGTEFWSSLGSGDLRFLPRFTWGYSPKPISKYRMISQLGWMGLWTHSMHPDDVYDTPENHPNVPYRLRNPETLPWRGEPSRHGAGLYHRFAEWLEFARKWYPCLRFERTMDAAGILGAHMNNDVGVYDRGNEVLVSMTRPGLFQVRFNDNRCISEGKISGAELVGQRRFSGYALYTLQARKRVMRIGVMQP
jgi:hypothetical protein